MIFRQLFDQESATYTYLLACQRTNDAIIIDPVINKIPLYLRLINELNLNLKYAIDTHMHADHITAIGELANSANCIAMMGEQAKVQGLGQTFKDNEVLKCGDLRLKAIYTPGHTKDSYCFHIENYLFTGDTLFIRGTGRTDFQEGNARDQYQSIFNKLLCLPESTYIYPGHDYNGMTVSTIGEEKKYNPRLKVRSADEYSTLMDSLDLAPPKLIDKAIPANRLCGIRDLRNTND